MTSRRSVTLALAVAAGVAASGTAHADQFLFTEKGASKVWLMNPASAAASKAIHTIRSNDADYNPGEGSQWLWTADALNDSFYRITASSGSGYNQRYELGTGGRTDYSYPKHIAVYNGEIFVMSRNDGTVFRYDQNGNQLGSFETGCDTGQGIATDGKDLFISVWDGSKSLFQRYNSSLILQDTYANPKGLDKKLYNNIFDFAFDTATGHWMGLVTKGENGASTYSQNVLEFTMGDKVYNTYTIGFKADGMGVPAPASLATLGLAITTGSIRRRKRAG